MSESTMESHLFLEDPTMDWKWSFVAFANMPGFRYHLHLPVRWYHANGNIAEVVVFNSVNRCEDGFKLSGLELQNNAQLKINNQKKTRRVTKLWTIWSTFVTVRIPFSVYVQNFRLKITFYTGMLKKHDFSCVDLHHWNALALFNINGSTSMC